MLTELEFSRISEMIINKMNERCSMCSKDLLDKRDALIYGGFGLVVFAVMIRYVPMIDKENFNRFVNLSLVGLSAYAFIWFKKKLEKRQEKYFLILLLIVTVYLLAPKALETVIQKLLPSFLH